MRQLVRKGGRYPTVEEIQDFARKRHCLASRINDFHMTSNRLLGVNKVAEVIGKEDVLNNDGYVSDEVRLPEDCRIAASMFKIENTILAFPSSVKGDRTLALQDLCNREC